MQLNLKGKIQAVAIFLLLVAAMLAAFIFSQGAGMFNVAKGSTQETTGPSIDCVGYTYTIKDVQLGNSSLAFIAENKDYGDKDISNVTVKTDANWTMTAQAKIIRGSEKRLLFENIRIGRNFTVYPDGCRIYEKTCLIATGECIAYSPGSHEGWS